MAQTHRATLTDQVLHDICAALSNHQSFKTACGLAGVKVKTAREWLEKGANDAPRADGETPTYAEFHLKVERAVAMSAGRLVQKLGSHSEAGSEKATMFLLEKRHSDDWGRKEVVEHVGSAEKPIQVQLVWPGSGVQDKDSELVAAPGMTLEIEAPDEIEDAVVVESSAPDPVRNEGGPSTDPA